MYVGATCTLKPEVALPNVAPAKVTPEGACSPRPPGSG